MWHRAMPAKREGSLCQNDSPKPDNRIPGLIPVPGLIPIPGLIPVPGLIPGAAITKNSLKSCNRGWE